MSSNFGDFLKQVRKRAGMTQDDLAAATGYSRSLIAALERNLRLPDLEVLIHTYLPALGLQEEPHVAAHLVELAALARGERPPASLTFTRERRMAIAQTSEEARPYLPLPPTELLGRDQVVNHLCQRLLGHHGRLLTLVGPPGVGKTRLAQAVGAALQRVYKDGALFVPLAAVSDPTVVADALVSGLKLQDGSSKPPPTRLIEHLRHKEMLLLVDNFEQLLAAAPLLADLLVECAGLRILVTSRERLHLRAEQRYRVPPLDLATAVQLFAQRSAAVNPDFLLTTANRPIVEAICQRLDRLPLAIELCAAQVDLLSLPHLLGGLQAHRLDLLMEGAQDVPVQHRTLRTAIGRSYALLQDEERTLFRSLGVFMGGFDLTALAAVIEGNAETGSERVNEDTIPQSHFSGIRSLVNKSLVHTEMLPSGEPRFLLLETLREFAREQLRVAGEEVEMRQRHYRTYLHLFRTADSHMRRADATTWLERLEVEQDNLRAALQWTLDTARYVDTAWLLKAASHFWYLNGHHYESAKWYARLLPHRPSLPVDLHLAILIGLFSAAGGLAEFPTLDQYRAEMIELIELCPSKQLQAVAWHFLAESDGEVARAYALAREANKAPDLCPEFGGLADHEFVLAAIQVSYASSLLHQGDVAQAALLVTDSLHRFHKQANHSFVADCLGKLGELALLRNNIAEAHSYLQESVTIGLTHNLPVVRAEWQWLLGLATLYRGDRSEAHRLLEECLRFCLAIKNTFFLACVCMGLAELALWEGELDQVRHWLGQSLTYQAAPKLITTTELQRLFIVARLAAAQGEYVRAAMLFGLAIETHRQIHYVYAGPMLPLVAAALATTQAALDQAVFDEALIVGQQMSLADAHATILAPSRVANASARR
jgi:predicted ATPase/transcriptional regulator with XRE-family HTH domain